MSRLRTLSHDAAVFTTGTAVAVTTSAVSITDAVTGKKAHVTNVNTLVTSARDPYNGAYQRFDSGGAAAVSVLPANRWNTLDGIALNGSAGMDNIATVVKPGKIALSSLTLAASGAAGSVDVTIALYIADSAGGDCATLTGASYTIAERFHVVVATGTTQHLTYPTPLVWSSYGATGNRTCMNVSAGSGPSGWAVQVSANGFYV